MLGGGDFCGVGFWEMFFKSWEVDFFQIVICFYCGGIHLIILFFVNIVFFFVFFYAIFYMFFDIFVVRFYFILTVFVFIMNLFLLCYDFLSAYIFWEFLGLFSFFLISFFWYRFYALKSGFKAFLMGKIGDLLFFFAIVNNLYIFCFFFFCFDFNLFFLIFYLSFIFCVLFCFVQ